MLHVLLSKVCRIGFAALASTDIESLSICLTTSSQESMLQFEQ
jgi:hypothetical protein